MSSGRNWLLKKVDNSLIRTIDIYLTTIALDYYLETIYMQSI